MSHANGKARFPDGVILHFEYNGTSDVCIPNLWDTYEEMHANWRGDQWATCTCGQPSEPVELYNDYGDGTYWPGEACRKCMAITKGLRTDEFSDDDLELLVKDGTPEWIKDES